MNSKLPLVKWNFFSKIDIRPVEFAAWNEMELSVNLSGYEKNVERFSFKDDRFWPFLSQR